MTRAVLSLLAAVALTMVFGAPAAAGVVEPRFAAHLETLGDGDFESALVYLQDRADIPAIDAELRSTGATLAARHTRVVSELKAAADRSQPALLTYLNSALDRGAVRGFTPYWIANLVVIEATKAEIHAIAQRLDVEAVEANIKPALIAPVGEPVMGSPLIGIGVTNSLKAINADRVWRELGITGAGTIIGGLDTGVDGNHPALASRWRGLFAPPSQCWKDALGSTTFPSDGDGHGTHTMGTMTGAGHATHDTVGVAWNALWIADNAIAQGVGPAFDSDVTAAFQWFADPDGNPNTTAEVPDVVQNSWGIDARFGGTYQDCDFRWQTVINNCEAAGVVVVFSAGNEGPSPRTHRSPANIANSPTVNYAIGAVDAENFGFPYPIAGFSSRGPSDCDLVSIKPEVSAPGVDVYSSFPGGQYGRLDGTSMAGPHVSGLVALMREANPNADVQMIKTAIMNTARDEGTAGEDNTYGWGVIDAFEAVLEVLVDPDAPPDILVNVSAINDTLMETEAGSREFTIRNTGGTITPLIFTISEDPPVAWASVSPVADTLASAQMAIVTVDLNTDGLAPGLHTTNLNIASNDPIDPLTIVAVNLLVVPRPVMYVDRENFEFALLPGNVGNGSYNLANQGGGTLDYAVSVSRVSGPSGGREQFANLVSASFGSGLCRGNVYSVNSAVQLSSSEFYLNLGQATPVEYFVYSSPTMTGIFNKIYSSGTVMRGPGVGFQVSPPINIPLNPGTFYYIGTAWNADATFWHDNGTIGVPEPTSFGALQYGVFSGSGFPAPPSQNLFASSIVYAQAVTVAGGVTIAMTTPTAGSVPAFGSVPQQFNASVNPTAPLGSYVFNIITTSNDPLTPSDIVDVQVNVVSSLTSVDGDLGRLPTAFALRQNEPNPFNPFTKVSFDLPRQSHVLLTVFDAQGRRVKTLVNGTIGPGRHEMPWQGLDENGAQVASGIYFLRMDAGDFSERVKMVLLK